MIEQETASIAKFIIDASGGIQPYYNKIPENFAVPSVYFPPPNIADQTDTLSTYGVSYSLFVKFFHMSDEKAYAAALPSYTEIGRNRRLIPMIDSAGKRTGRYVRIKNYSLSWIDEGAYQLQIEWVSRRLFPQKEEPLIQNFYLNGGRL